jgi:hypothetical protein
LPIQPDGLIKSMVRDPLAAKLYAGSAQLSGHGRPVEAPVGGERLHVCAVLVLSNEPLDLLGRQSALDLPLLYGCTPTRSSAQQGRLRLG